MGMETIIYKSPVCVLFCVLSEFAKNFKLFFQKWKILGYQNPFYFVEGDIKLKDMDIVNFL